EDLGVGLGTDEIYDAAYQRIAAVSAGNGYQADLHDLQITPQGSAFITAYSLVDADLSSVGGARDGTLQDGLLQEIDIPTGLVMFEWHAYGHVELSDSYSQGPSSAGTPWDFFHLNSVSLDPWGDGNLIVSARNTWTAYEINHVTGAVVWRLGGKRSSFKMGAGTGTAYQHDVRWQPDHTLTIFDNGGVPKAHSQTRVIRERIDWAHRQGTLVSRYGRTPGPLAGHQGDDEVLGNGNSFVGWGEDPYFSEFSPTGQMLFDGHLPAPGQSYRAYRFPWSATPAAPPSVAVSARGGQATIYASWNGATSVSSWRVIAGSRPTGLQPIATAPAAGFETTITVQSSDRYFAAQAIGDSGQVLGSSPVRWVPGAASTTLRSCEGGDPCRRLRLGTQRGDRGAPQADGGDRRQADPVAHHEDLCGPRHRGVHRLPRLQGLSDQGVLRQLLPAHVRRHLRPRQRRHGGPPLRDRALAGHARGHGRGDDDRRAPAARAALSGGRGLLLHLWRRSGRCGRERAAGLSPRAGRDGHGHRRAATRALRRPRRGRHQGARVRGEAARRRRLDERWLLRALAGRRRLSAGRRHRMGAGADAGAGARGSALLLPPRRLLAGDGHAARPQPPRAAVAVRTGAVADMGVTP